MIEGLKCYACESELHQTGGPEWEDAEYNNDRRPVLMECTGCGRDFHFYINPEFRVIQMPMYRA